MNLDHVCRCCLSETCFKDISNEYTYGDKIVVYADMLYNTFNINITYQEDNSRLICEDCIVRLRDAAAFKNQVEKAEEAIVSKSFNGVSLNKETVIISDYKDDFLDYITGEFEDGDDDENDECCTDDRNNDGLEWQESPLKDSVDENNLYITLEASEEIDDLPLLLRMKKLKRKKVAKVKPKKNIEKETKNIKPHIIRKQNSLKLIMNSNLCLFESLKTKFGCFYCKKSYLNMTELRIHALTHSNEKYLKMCFNRLKGMSFKNVEISDLICKICSQSLTDLNSLKDHLNSAHNIEFSNDEHILIPYNLKNGFNCLFCDGKFNTFSKLSIHMNSHYTNHVCEVCGQSYINRISLRLHVEGMHREKKCTSCDAVFSNMSLRVKHMRKVHNTSYSKRYCLLCNKTFRYTYLLNEHKIQEHGMKREILTCGECGKTFNAGVNLRTHTRSVHMKERPHVCSRCPMAFFTSCDRRRHEATHYDHRLFACNYCEGRFKSKDSLRRHLKRQHGNYFM